MRSRDLALTPFAAVLAPPTASIACQCEWDHSNREDMPSANITHSQSESIAVSSYPSMPSTTEAISQSRIHPHGSRDQAQNQKSREADTNPRQPSVTLRNARHCKRFLAGAGLLGRISSWNHQIFCVDSSWFISPQGSHALWDGKIVRPRYDLGPRTPPQERSWSILKK